MGEMSQRIREQVANARACHEQEPIDFDDVLSLCQRVEIMEKAMVSRETSTVDSDHDVPPDRWVLELHDSREGKDEWIDWVYSSYFEEVMNELMLWRSGHMHPGFDRARLNAPRRIV